MDDLLVTRNLEEKMNEFKKILMNMLEKSNPSLLSS